MIKIKIKDPFMGKNRISFHGFYMMRELFRDYSIDITNSDDYDYMFIGAHDILDKGLDLQDSIDYGLETCSKITGDYFLFDGCDSTSLIGSYEVFEKSDAKFLFKNQRLKNREDYLKPTVLNKWFFRDGSDLDKGYDIPEETWSRIKLSGWNLGYFQGDQFRPDVAKEYPVCEEKTVDLCAIYQAFHKENTEHLIRNDIYYTNHRSGAWESIGDDPGYSFVKDKLPFQEYMNALYRSRLALSPFGMGEVCYRDFEILGLGVAMIKPSMELVDTSPNCYVEDETYIPVNLDWSNLNEVVKKTLDNPKKIQYIIESSRQKYKEIYSAHSFCMHWYKFFSDLGGVKSG